MLQSGSHLKLFQPLHELDIIEKQSPHHDDKVCLQQYCVAEIGNGFFIDLNVRVQAENFGFEDK